MTSGENNFTSFYKRWSSKPKIEGDFEELEERIQSDLKDINKSFDFVNRWREDVSKVFNEVINKTVKEFVEKHVSSNDTADGSNELYDNSVIKKFDHIARKVNEIRSHSTYFRGLPAINRDDYTGPSTKWGRTESESKEMKAQDTYDGLKEQLKNCFLCLSIFPEEATINKRSLINWWIGEEFAGDQESGEICFNVLCEKGLIQPIYDDCSKSRHSCRLDPSIRWMAIRKAMEYKETKFLDFDFDGKPCSVPSDCPRRTCVATTRERRAEKVHLGPTEPTETESEIRSLLNIDLQYLQFDENEFRKAKKMVVLQLGRWINNLDHHIEVVNPTFLRHLGLLKDLRYLGLRGISKITELPESIKELKELRVLDLRACHSLEKLPDEIVCLTNLQHLDVSECYLLKYMPKNLGSLSELQYLDGFVISTLRNKKACKLSELTALRKLRKLGISFSVEAMTADWELDALEKIQGLQKLKITWGRGEARDGEKPKKPSAPKKLTGKPKPNPPSKISLSLPPNLTKLDLRCFPLQEAPELRKIKCLEKLYFRGGKLISLRGIQGGGEVSKVEIVRLRLLSDFYIERPKLEEIFPQLKHAEISNCPRITTSFLNDSVTPVYWINGVRFPQNSESGSKI